MLDQEVVASAKIVGGLDHTRIQTLTHWWVQESETLSSTQVNNHTGM